MTDKCRIGFEEWFSDSVLPVSKSDEGYFTKEALEWCYQAAYDKRTKDANELVEAAIEAKRLMGFTNNAKIAEAFRVLDEALAKYKGEV